MNILFASSELTPYAKTGGLGDVMAALPAALREEEHSISFVIPLFQSLRSTMKNLEPTSLILTIPHGQSMVEGRVWQGVTREGVIIFAIENEAFFDRPSLYGDQYGDYPDNASRFTFFSKAAVELARYVDPQPDIIHANDWTVGLIPAIVKDGGLPYRTVYTIHNLAYQGSFPALDFDYTNLSPGYFSPEGVEFYGQLNFMKAGIMMADQVTTVSPSYAEEIQRGDMGHGLAGVLGHRSGDLTGILNGIDTDIWNPKKDKFLKQNYDSKSLKDKKECKINLQKAMGFDDIKKKKPLFGCVSRLVEHKGFELVIGVMDRLLESGARFVLLGSGERRYEDYFRWLQETNPDQVRVKIGFDEKLAHQIEAGSDMFLMPSLTEPCGLNQLYSVRYGTVPVVHATGGLKDSITPWNTITKEGNGFKFYDFHADAFWAEIERALVVFEDKDLWEKLQVNGMEEEHGWKGRVTAYEDVYQRAMK